MSSVGKDGTNAIMDMLIDKHVPVMVEKMSWKPFENILHYGCGVGTHTSRFLYPLAERHSSGVTGVDRSTENIESAQEKHPHILATYTVGDIMVEDKFKWPLLNVKFDKILCVDDIHSIHNYREFLTRLLEQLHKRGQVAFGVHYASWLKIHHFLAEHPKWRKYLSGMKKAQASWVYEAIEEFPESVRQILETQCTAVIDFHVQEETHTYQSLDQFVDFLLASNVGTKNVPDELEPELREDVSNFVAELCRQSRGCKPFPVKINYLRFVAERHV